MNFSQGSWFYVSKARYNSKEKIEKSIDNILGNLNIRPRDHEKQESKKEVEILKQKLAVYEEMIGSLESLNYRKEQLLKEISLLEQEFQKSGSRSQLNEKEMSLHERNKHTYQPSSIIRQYCEQPEGKRKLTIHLREIEYQAILKASHVSRSKGQLMDVITKALRFYIPPQYYEEAEYEVSVKAVESVRVLLEEMGFSTEEIEQRLRRA